MEIDKLISYINMSKKTVFFGGAGVSTASGLQEVSTRRDFISYFLYETY